ncbi:MAG: hypothetical protein KatS3mg015_1372 [Fimbriimonadales bacterium]|nr:MAG: hypothetical protein KatS3mg015_1372 [Fimbriimonadales bacterium]
MLHLLVASMLSGGIASGVAGVNPQGVFLENRGQWNGEARYLMRSPNLDTWVTDDGLVYQFYKVEWVPNDPKADPYDTTYRFEGHSRVTGQAIRMRFAGSSGQAVHRGEALSTKYHYYIGKRDRWARGVQAYPEARIENLYPGVEAVIYADGTAPRYDLILAPGADPRQIRMQFEGQFGLRLSPEGSLRAATVFGDVSLGGLYAYQDLGGKQVRVPARFRINRDGTVGFELGKYDRSKPLVIDPIVQSRFIGGNNVDNATVISQLAGGPVVAGETYSPNFPASGVFTYTGAYDAYVIVYDNTWTPVWASFLGSSLDDFAGGVGYQPTTDGTNVWLAITVGNMADTDFDVNIGDGGGTDILAVEFLFDGSDVDDDIGIGSTANDYLTDMVMYIDGDDAARLQYTGYTFGADFPVGTADNFLLGFGGFRDAFVCRVNTSDDSLEFGLFLGGSQDDIANDMVLESVSGNSTTVVIGGRTASASFPHGNNSWGGDFKGASDGFVARIFFDPDNPFDPIAHLTHSTLAGGSAFDEVRGIAVSGSGAVYATGRTSSADFPTTTGAYDTTYNGSSDAFAFAVNSAFTSATYSTYIGAADFDVANGIALATGNTAIIGGETWSQQFPITSNADDSTFNGQSDAFLLRLAADGSGLEFSSFYGGAGVEMVNRILPLGGTSALVVGKTGSSSFPTTGGPAFAGGQDAFLMQADTPGGSVVLTGLRIEPNQGIGGAFSATGTVTLSGPAGAPTLVILSSDNGFVTVPLSVTVPAGQSEATFPVTTSNPPSRQIATITANLGVDSRMATVTVDPNILVSLTMAEPAVTGGQTGTGIVQLLAAAPPGGLVVNLSVDTAAVIVPPTVTVPAGSKTATFPVTTFPTHVSLEATIVASLNSFGQKAKIIVLPPVVFSTTVTPRQVQGGNGATFRVILSGQAPPGGYLVRLFSSHPNVASMPATVVVPAGATFVDVPVTTFPVQQSVDVTLSADRITRRSSNLLVTP